MTLQELHEKDVIQLKTGENLGRIDDIELDRESARVQAVILRGRGRCLGLLGRDEDLVIPWEAIQRIGTDVLMVDFTPPPASPSTRRRGWPL